MKTTTIIGCIASLLAISIYRVQSIEADNGIVDNLEDPIAKDSPDASDRDKVLTEDMEDRELTYYDYDSYEDYACRTKKGGRGYEGYHYTKYHKTAHECKEYCDYYGSDCKAYETGSNKHCEIWWFYPPKKDYYHGLTCHKKKEYTPPAPTPPAPSPSSHGDYYYYAYNNKYCRTEDYGRGKKGVDYYYHNYHDCQDLCDNYYHWYGEHCYAYEKGPHGHCEIWKYLPPYVASGHGYKCVHKIYY